MGATRFLAPLISTRLQSGVAKREESGSRFNGFGGGTATAAAEKTAKAVVSIPIPKHPAEAGDLFSAKGADLYQPGATPQETSHLPLER